MYVTSCELPGSAIHFFRRFDAHMFEHTFLKQQNIHIYYKHVVFKIHFELNVVKFSKLCGELIIIYLMWRGGAAAEPHAYFRHFVVRCAHFGKCVSVYAV